MTCSGEVVNRIYCGVIEQFSTESLSSVDDYLKITGFTTKFYSPRPYMVRVRMDNMTMLFFSHGRFRCMGNCESSTDLMRTKLYDLLHLLPLFNIEIYHVSSTVSTKIPSDLISLDYFANRNSQPGVLYEIELFPALQLRMWPGVHVNIFQTGSIIMMGQNAEALCSNILDWIFEHM